MCEGGGGAFDVKWERQWQLGVQRSNKVLGAGVFKVKRAFSHLVATQSWKLPFVARRLLT